MICLQELKSTVAQVPAALCELQGYRCYWHGERAYSGVGLHIRREAFARSRLFAIPVSISRLGSSRRSSAISCSRPSTYPTAARTSPPRCAFCGDGGVRRGGCGPITSGSSCAAISTSRAPNATSTPRSAIPIAVGQRPEEREIFERILAQGLTDVGRALDPENDNLFTWWAPWRNMRARNIGWRLDYFWRAKLWQ